METGCRDQKNGEGAKRKELLLSISQERNHARNPHKKLQLTNTSYLLILHDINPRTINTYTQGCAQLLYILHLQETQGVGEEPLQHCNSFKVYSLGGQIAAANVLNTAGNVHKSANSCKFPHAVLIVGGPFVACIIFMSKMQGGVG